MERKKRRVSDRGSLGTSARAGQSPCVKEFLKAMELSLEGVVCDVQVLLTASRRLPGHACPGQARVRNPTSSFWPEPLSVTTFSAFLKSHHPA